MSDVQDILNHRENTPQRASRPARAGGAEFESVVDSVEQQMFSMDTLVANLAASPAVEPSPNRSTHRIPAHSEPRQDAPAQHDAAQREAVQFNPSPSETPQPADAAPPALINWTQLRPDGTAKSVHQLATWLSGIFGGKVALGITLGRTVDVYRPDAQDDSNTQTPTLFLSAATEAAAATKSCFFATEKSHTSGVLKNLRDAEHLTLVLSFGVEPPDKPTAANAAPSSPSTTGKSATTVDRLGCAGIVLRVVAPSEVKPQKQYAALVEQLRVELPQWLSVWQNCKLGIESATWRNRLRAARGRKGKLALLATFIALGLLAVPVPYRPQRECVVEPAKRAYIASPIAGNVSQSSVRPGDVVAQGELIASLDAEPIRWELAAAEAEYEAASNRRESAMASRSGGDMRIAQLEQERVDLRIRALQRRLEQLEIRSPIDGIIVQGDWFQNEGAPVSLGDTLFEVSPLHEMQIETHLTTQDLSLIQTGTPAVARFDSAAGEKWTGTLERIDPRGQISDAQVIFVADMILPNRDNLLRPGMKGTTRLLAGSKSIGWQLFNDPYRWVMKKLAW